MTDREILEHIWWAGVRAVGGHQAVSHALQTAALQRPDRIIAVGKAAADMCKAATDHFGDDIPGLVVTKYDHAAQAGLPAAIRVIEAAHPVPDENSLKAGAALMAEIADMPAGSRLLFLASGGASSLAEVPAPGLTLDDVMEKNRALLASGQDIHAMNAQRRQISQIKGGQLLARFGGASITSLAISDVEGDDLGVIGSGIGSCAGTPTFSFRAEIVASNAIARKAAETAAAALNLQVISNSETLYGDVEEVASRVAPDLLSGVPGVRIWGGEPTVVLPENPGQGGRNQGLALLLARQVAGSDGVSVLVGGTDGSDGPTKAAGAVVDGTSWEAASGILALKAADSGRYFATRNLLLTSGPTGTNVMDLMIALQR